MYVWCVISRVKCKQTIYNSAEASVHYEEIANEIEKRDDEGGQKVKK